jgi:ArsR family transcriptional regulator, arsenate/arsenite/antimonite-responsive transcriptional repressor / arsenate reductase (thioredoxin)
MNEDSASYADVFAALGSEARLDVMRLLFAAYPEGMTVGDLQTQLKIPNSTLSHHLEKLRVEKLVTVQKDRQFLWYKANVETIEAVLTFLYNGCSIRNQALRNEGDQQIPELNTEKTSSQESFMFEDFFRSVQTFFGGLPFEMPGFERFTEKAIQVITLAQEESRRLKHQYVGTEQILLGLIAQETGLVSQFFKSVGIELEPVRQAIERQIGRGKGTPEKIPFTPRAKKTLDIALKQAKQFKHSYIGTEHMLLGLLIERQGLGVQVLEKLGFNCETLEQQLRIAIDQSSV